MCLTLLLPRKFWSNDVLASVAAWGAQPLCEQFDSVGLEMLGPADLESELPVRSGPFCDVLVGVGQPAFWHMSLLVLSSFYPTLLRSTPAGPTPPVLLSTSTPLTLHA